VERALGIYLTEVEVRNSEWTLDFVFKGYRLIWRDMTHLTFRYRVTFEDDTTAQISLSKDPADPRTLPQGFVVDEWLYERDYGHCMFKYHDSPKLLKQMHPEDVNFIIWCAGLEIHYPENFNP
jgi:hypothetical protein